MRIRASLAAMALAVSFVACGGDGDDGTGPDGDSTVTASEAAGMMAALSTAGAFTMNTSNFNVGAGGTSGNFDYSSNCPGGGSIRAQGNFSYTLSNNVYAYNGTITQTYNGCKAAGSGTTYTFNGSAITVTYTFNMNLSAGTYSYNLKEKGNLSWAGGSRSGSCPIDFTVATSSTGAYTYTGTYCDVKIG